jgi:hypothetical protein
MTKVRTFARNFPKYHPQIGQPTHFVEQILNAKNINYHKHDYFDMLVELNRNSDIDLNTLSNFAQILSGSIRRTECKNHTIREGNHFKVGDKFSPRVWSGLPYKSKQIIFAPDIEVKQVSALPSKCGEWQLVDSHPDFTIKFVTEFPDISIKLINDFPNSK